ncbi:tail fiber domain-containing protein [Taklimakanibacter deserti]|uniref:tail fiber domain-containing protein n=1 Tax=Taklimakanibacter deserti TaxID=2267839 RepID=UPI000E64DFBE
MAKLANFAETPNLMELAEASGLPGRLIELSLCADEGGDGLTGISPCADELGLQQSVCVDEAMFSVCADEIESDIRLKTDIEQVGTTVYGLPLYRFRYKTGTERFEGVMAQDVLEVMPDAVVVGEDGYYRVKYGQLGIGMTRA